MKENLVVLAKVMGLSLGVAIAIKTIGPLWTVTPTPALVWAIVLLPSTLMASWLGWLTWKS